MLIRGLSARNPKVSFDNISLNFQQCGINILRGKNGVGKTTILNAILFYTYETCFPTSEQQDCFIKSRHNLFAYVPQDIPLSNVSVRDFLIKGNRNIDIDLINNYMVEFKIGEIALSAKFNSLSGGEKTKLSIISALAKNTPYIFMDEPTNHLDDSSVQVLLNIIQRLSVDRTFIIICHDSRFEPDEYNIIQVNENKITPIKKSTKPLNELECGTGEKRYSKLIKNILVNLMSFVVTYTFIGLAVFALMFNSREYQIGYSTDTFHADKDIVLCYSAERMYSDSNRVYATAEKLKIREEDFMRTITFEDIDKIVAMEGVAQIVVYNHQKFYGDYSDATIKPLFMKFPEDITQNFSKMYLYSIRCMLEMGEYPADDAKEVCLSKDIVTDYYNLELESAIGQSIEYQGDSYRITGILENNSGACLMSFESSDSSAFYRYSQDSWAKYYQSLDEDQICEILIYTLPGQEAYVLNQMMTTFPAHNYNSNYFGHQWVKQYNKLFVLKRILPINLGVAIIMSIIILLVRKYHLALSKGLLKDYAHYYLDRVAPANIYFLTSVLMFGAILLLSIILNFLYSPYAYASSSILALDLFIAFTPSMLYTLRRVRHAV